MENQAWQEDAKALCEQGRMTELEELIQGAVKSQEFALEIAGAYRDRWLRLVGGGEWSAAREAKRRAAYWAYFYASQATSGGEGTAMSRERDEFLKTIGEYPPGA